MDLLAVLTSWPVLICGVVALLIYKYGTRAFGTLEKLNIPVVPPRPFYGSIVSDDVILMEDDVKTAKKYGKVYGYYTKMSPQVFIADADMARRIFIKDFDHFTDHPLELFDIDLGRDMLDMLKGDRWKAVRQILSAPLASGVKLKGMMPTLEQCIEDACERLDKMLPEKSELKIKSQFYSPMILDVIAQYSFGMKVKDIAEPTNPFVKHASMFDDDESGVMYASQATKIIDFLTTIFPPLHTYILGKFTKPSITYFLDLLRDQIKQRRASGQERPDLIGMFIDAIDNKVPTAEFKRLNITEQTLLLQGTELIMAAYSTTGATLALASYHLTAHPGTMAKVVEEVDNLEELTYESVQELPFLDAVIKETMRVTPVLIRHSRECVKDWEYNELRIPAGTYIQIPVMPYHMDPEVFPEPKVFKPERWLGEKGRSLGVNHYMPFGGGPRTCPGQRLAMLEMKYIFAYVLKRYTLSATEKTKLIYNKGNREFMPYGPITVKVEKRDH